MFKIYDIIVNSDKIIKPDEDIIFITFQRDNSNKYTTIEYNDKIYKKYDKIIVINLFFNYKNNNNNVEEYKKYLNKNGKLIFIEQFIIYDYDVISFFIGKNIKMNEIFDIIYRNELFIIDVDRIFSNSTFLFRTTEYFSIICVNTGSMT